MAACTLAGQLGGLSKTCHMGTVEVFNTQVCLGSQTAQNACPWTHASSLSVPVPFFDSMSFKIALCSSLSSAQLPIRQDALYFVVSLMA